MNSGYQLAVYLKLRVRFFEQIDQALTPEKLEQLCLSLYQKVPDQGKQKNCQSGRTDTFDVY